jgi:hypothetical protein
MMCTHWGSKRSIDPTIGAIQDAILDCTVRYTQDHQREKKRQRDLVAI